MFVPAGTLAHAQDPLSWFLDPEPLRPDVTFRRGAGNYRHPLRRASGLRDVGGMAAHDHYHDDVSAA